MKYLFIIFFFLSNKISANYSKHPNAKEVIATLVRDHGFEKNYVIKILESAKNKKKFCNQCHLLQNLLGLGIGIKNFYREKEFLMVKNLLKKMHLF